MIGVPSKGRAGKSATLAMLDEQDEVTVAVPVEEQSVYESIYPHFAILPVEEPGIGNARQALLTAARNDEWGAFWMLDDDITGFFWRVGRKLVRTEIGPALNLMEDVLSEQKVGPVALAGPQFRHRAWAGPDVEVDKHLRNVVHVEPQAPIDYPPILKEDLDVVLQALTQGWHTVRFNLVAFDSPQMGTSQGGCREDYDAGKLDDACRALVERWPGLVEYDLDNKTGRLTNRVNWKAVREGWFR